MLKLDNLNSYPTCYNKYKPTQETIAARCKVSANTVSVVGKQYNKESREVTLTRKKRVEPPIQPIVTGDIEDRVISLACGSLPEGYSRWTLRLLESKIVELGIMEQVSDTTIFRVKKTELKPHLKDCWCIPPEQNAAFVSSMCGIYGRKTLSIVGSTLDTSAYGTWYTGA